MTKLSSAEPLTESVSRAVFDNFSKTVNKLRHLQNLRYSYTCTGLESFSRDDNAKHCFTPKTRGQRPCILVAMGKYAGDCESVLESTRTTIPGHTLVRCDPAADTHMPYHKKRHRAAQEVVHG